MMLPRIAGMPAARCVSRRMLVKGVAAAALGGRCAHVTEEARAACELVEVYPGYPGYRGYITGLNGVGDHVCLEQLTAMDPSFSRVSQVAQNLVAAQRIGLSGTMVEWTWENWMAVEAERGLPPSCYTRALMTGAPPVVTNGFQPDPADPRLLVGGLQGTRLSGRYLRKKGLPLYQQSSLPFDHDLVVLVGIARPHAHPTAAEIVAAADSWFDLFFTPGTFLDPHRLWIRLLEQGGYAPRTGHETAQDQIFMVLAGIAALRNLLGQDAYSAVLATFRNAVQDWQDSRLRDASTPALGEWLRERGAATWFY